VRGGAEELAGPCDARGYAGLRFFAPPAGVVGALVTEAPVDGQDPVYEDWQALGRDLIARGLGAPMLTSPTAPRACLPGRALVVHLRYRSRPAGDGGAQTCSSARSARSRGTKVMGRSPGEESCLTLVWAVPDLLITHQTNGIRSNPLDRPRLKRMSYRGTSANIPRGDQRRLD